MSRPPRLTRAHAELVRVAEALRRDKVAGALLLAAAAVALVWANSPWAASYTALSRTTIGPAALHLDLTLAIWAADALLAIFFFVVGLELKREMVVGDLRSPARALLPVAAAVGGVIAPAVLYVLITLGTDGAGRGWAIPTATDIAFALAVLAVLGRHLPGGLRTFLLTLAIVDDLIAIAIIAVVYAGAVSLGPLLLALVSLGAFATLLRRGVRSAWLLVPLAVATWVLVHESGVHATVAGVALGFAVPVAPAGRADGPEDGLDLAARFEHRWRPLSAGLAVPVFAFFAAGVSVTGGAGPDGAFSDPVTIGIVVGLVAGKAVGVLAATYLAARFTRARLDEELAWWDVLGLSLLAGIGFTVSFLVGELAFGAGSPREDHVKLGILLGSTVSALLAAVVLRWRDRLYRRWAEAG